MGLCESRNIKNSELINPNGLTFSTIHGVPLHEVAREVSFISHLALVDVGSGCGAVLASILGEQKKCGMCTDYPGIIAVDPSPNQFAKDTKLDIKSYARYKPHVMTAQQLHSILPPNAHIGMLLSWPDNSYDADLGAIMLLKPQAIVLITGHLYTPNSSGLPTTIWMSGTNELHDKLLGPIQAKKRVTLEPGLTYKLTRQSEYSCGKACMDDEYSRHELRFIPQEKRSCFRVLWALTRIPD